jgi:predicted nucleotidyltransferase
MEGSQNGTDPVISEAVGSLRKFSPKSVFVYGSRGWGDATPNSDYEIGVIFEDDKYVRRADIHAAVTNPKVKAYPFRWNELRNGSLDFLFQKSSICVSSFRAVGQSLEKTY